MKLHELLKEHQISRSGRDVNQKKPAVADSPVFDGAVQDLETVLSVVRKINTSLVPSDVLASVIDHAIRITHAERGFLMLADKSGKLQYVVGQDKEGSVI